MSTQKENQEAFKLTCQSLQYKVNEAKGRVTAIETFIIPYPLWLNSKFQHFTTIGVAKVNKEAGDVFNVEVGEKIARAKAEKGAFEIFKIIALTYKKELQRDLQKVDNTIEKMNDCILHQKEYIKSF